MVGACLLSHWVTWQQYGAETWLLDVLREGYLLPFEPWPSLTNSPVRLLTYVPGSTKDLALVQSKGAVEVMSDRSPGFYSHVFLVEKDSGGWRLVIDLSPLN